MSRIYDNIDLKFEAGLKGILGNSGMKRADFCVGYFNLRGWRMICDMIDALPGDYLYENDDRVFRTCRLLIGMHRPPEELIQKLYSCFEQHETPDSDEVKRCKRQMSMEFRRQLVCGVPSTQDEWALRSQQLYHAAFKAGKFEDEIVPIEIPRDKGEPLIIKDDQSPRPSTTLEGLAKLKTVNKSPTVTAGNAPGLSTGAAMVLLMSADEAEKRGIAPLATLVAHAQASEHPKGIASIPAYAAQRALKKAGMTIDQMDVIEINEAFAAMPLVSTILLGERNEARIAALREKTNVNGGAIAVGHPTGASGARLLMTLSYELRRRGGGYGLCTICGGVGESECFIVKV